YLSAYYCTRFSTLSGAIPSFSPLPPFFFLCIRPPPTSPLFPYTTLFRSPRAGTRCIGSRACRFHGPVAQRLEPTAHNGLVGGSSPPGPTMICFGSFDLNALAPKLSSVNTMLDKNLFTIRPRSVSPSPREPCACGRPPWCNAALLKAMHGRGLPRFGLRCIRSQRAAAPPPYASHAPIRPNSWLRRRDRGTSCRILGRYRACRNASQGTS